MENSYTFTVECDTTNNAESFMDTLLSEVNNEKNQLGLTHKINIETSRTHREILSSLVKEINKVIEPHGAKYYDEQVSNTTNGYSDYTYICNFNNRFSSAIIITACADREFKDSKYSTYTGEYSIRITRFREMISRHSHEIRSSIKNVDDVLKYIRFDLKSHIENNNR